MRPCRNPWYRAVTVLGLLALLGLGSACGEGPEVSPQAVGTIGGEPVGMAVFQEYLERSLGKEAQALPSEVLSGLLDQFLEEELLARLAVERGVVSAEASRRQAVDRLLAAETPDDPDAQSVERYYRTHRDEFARPERVRLQQILIEEREIAVKALEELRAGAPFEEVAGRYSRDPDAGAKGVPGELSRDDLPPSFVEPIFSLDPGGVSDIVEADYGYHIFRVEQRLPAQVVSLDVARGEIRQRLLETATNEALERLVREARNRYDVEVYEQNLPFDYRGQYRADDS